MKSLAKNSAYNIIYKCSTVVFPLITAAYVSRVLMADGIGKINSAQNIVQYFTILAALGLPTYGTKMIAAVSDNKERLSKTFGELFFINAVSSLILSVVYYTIVFVAPYFKERMALYCICGLLIPFNVINVDWFYQGKEEFKFITIRSLIVKLASFGLTFVFVKTSDDWVYYALLLVFANVFNYVFNIIYLKKFINFKISKINVKRHFKPLFILLSASIAIEIYTLADTTMLTIMSGDAAVGYYSNSVRIIRLVRTFVTAISAVYLPRLSYLYANGKKDEFIRLIENGFKILMIVSFPIGLGLCLVSKQLIPVFYGSGFINSILVTQILSLSVVTVAYSNFIGNQVLVTIGKEKIMFHSTVIGAITNIIMNYFLISSLSYVGAAIASAITELVVTVFQLVFMSSFIKIKYDFKFICSVLAALLAMTISVFWIKTFVKSIVLSLMLSVSMGAVIYAAILFITKNEFALLILSKIKSKNR